MEIKEIMNRRIITLPATASVREAAELLQDHGVGDVVVLSEDGDPEGMITDRDIAVRCVAEGLPPARTRVADCMSDELIYCYDDSSVEEAAALMSARRIRRLPVMDRRTDELVGMLSLGDLAVHLGRSPVVTDTLRNISSRAA